MDGVDSDNESSYGQPMTLDQLHVLCAVVDEGGFHAASVALFRSQSAISIAIKKLELDLGIALFDRQAYRPTLTAEGKVLYGKAKSILARCDDLKHTAEHFAQGEETELSMAMSAIAPVEQLLSVIQSVSQQAPATRMNLQVENMGGTVERLLDKEVDFAISERFFSVPHTQEVRLTSTQMVAVISPDFPLAYRYQGLKTRDLETFVQVVVRDTSRKQKGQTAGVLEGAPQWLVNDFDMKKRMILSGSGWGRMPFHRIHEELKDGRLLALSGAELEPVTVDMYLLRRAHELLGPVGESLWLALQAGQYDASCN